MTDERLLSALGGNWSDATGCFGASLWGLYAAALALDAKTVLEIGVGKGGSTRAFLLAMRRTGGQLWSIDCDPACPSRIPTELQNRWIFRDGRSQDLADDADLPTELDLLFLDGEHTEAAVSLELAEYGSRVRPGGLIWLDDCWGEGLGDGDLSGHRGFPGVRRAFDACRVGCQRWIVPYGVPQSQPGGPNRSYGIIRV